MNTFLLHFYMSVHKWDIYHVAQVTNATQANVEQFLLTDHPVEKKHEASAQTSLKALTGRKT